MPIIPEHGGKYYFKDNILYDFSININPLGYPKNLKDLILKNFELLKEYPPENGENFIKKFSEIYSISSENLIACNGSIQLIYTIPYSLDIKKAIIVSPNFSEYEKSLKLNKTEILHFFLKEDNEFIFSINDFLKFIKNFNKFDAVILCNPSNPCGTVICKEKLIELLETLNKLNSILIIDEAFIDFSDEKSLLDLNYPNLIIIKSLTKIFAIPGLRLGICKTNRKIAEKIKKFIPPWSVNIFSLIAGEFLIEEKEFLKKTKNFVKQERSYVFNELSKIKEIKVFNSFTNFFLIKILNEKNAFLLQDYLLKKKILIRNCSNFTGLDEKFFRIGLKTRNENIILIQNLIKFFRGEK